MKTRATKALTFPFLSAAAIAAAGGCGEDVSTLVVARCTQDVECADGFICEQGECIPKDTVSCETIGDGAAILQPGPPVLDFGQVGPATTFKSLKLRNIGNCTLTIFEVAFQGGNAQSFECPECSTDRFPIELFPLRESEIEIAFTPDGVGLFESEMHLLSDDPEYNEIRVPVRAYFEGVPDARVIPDKIDFSYVPVGRTVREVIQITNHGTGSAPLTITDIRLHPTGTTAFSFEPELTMPIELQPTSVDPMAAYTFFVDYHPREVGIHTGEIVISTNQVRNGTFRVALTGTSKTPPKINVSPERIEFGTVPLGRTNHHPLTIINEGGSALTVRYRWAGTGLTTDLSALPAILPVVEPGQYTELAVFVSATAIGEIAGLLVLETNDPQRPTVTIPVSATGTDVTGDPVVKLELSYENGDSGFFGDDLRNVDMALESPYGHICNKQLPNPMNWGSFGNPTWFAFGANEEPERIILPDAQSDGTYRVLLQYAEDCSSVPTRLLASILGISIDALLGYFSGGTINLDSQAISDAIASICFDHDSTTAVVTVFINGTAVAQVSSGLGRKGDLVYAFELVRQSGQFFVR